MMSKVVAALLAFTALVSMAANAPGWSLVYAGPSLAGASGAAANDIGEDHFAIGTLRSGEVPVMASDITDLDIAEWLAGAGPGQADEMSPERLAWSQFDFSTLGLTYAAPGSFGTGAYAPDDALFALQQIERAMPIGSFLAGGGAGGTSRTGKKDPAGSAPESPTSGNEPMSNGPTGNDAGPAKQGNPAGSAEESPSDDDSPGTNDGSPPDSSTPTDDSLPPEGSLPRDDSFPVNEQPVSVPEPTSFALFGLGLIGLSLTRRRRSRV